MGKKISYFSITDIIRKKFKKAKSRGLLGKDVEGNSYFYGILEKEGEFTVVILFTSIDHVIHEKEKVIFPLLIEAEKYIREYKVGKGIV
jgi:hypothetical protein